jgi:hypothetical protein
MTGDQDGGCRCGQVRFRVTGAPLVTMACHCTGCQRMTGGAYSLSSLYPAGKFAVTAGEPVQGGLRGTPRHQFCPSCMSWVFTEVDGGFVNVRSTMLDDPSGHRPFIDTYVSEKLPWAESGAARGFAAFPEMDAYPELMAAYAGWDRR